MILQIYAINDIICLSSNIDGDKKKKLPFSETASSSSVVYKTSFSAG